MKKLLITTFASAMVLSAASSFAADTQKSKAAPTVESITKRIEQRLESNPNIKLESVTEKDGQFTVRIVTKDGSLVEEKTIDPKNKAAYKHLTTPLSVERTKEILEGRLAVRANPNIKLGEITEVDGVIKASIVTQDGSLVNEADIDPNNPLEGLRKLQMGFGKGHMGKNRMGKGYMGKGHMGKGHMGKKHMMMDDDMQKMNEKWKNMSTEEKEKFMESHKDIMMDQ